jgi:hypothetical protein
MSQMPNGPEMSLRLKGCRADLRDNVIYHDSQFIDSYISSSGTGPLRFAVTNEVPGSPLKLAADVDITRADVHSLMCGFPWKALYIGDHEIHPTCKSISSVTVNDNVLYHSLPELASGKGRSELRTISASLALRCLPDFPTKACAANCWLKGTSPQAPRCCPWFPIMRQPAGLLPIPQSSDQWPPGRK